MVCYQIFSIIIRVTLKMLILSFLLLISLTSNTSAASKTLSNEVSPSTRAFDHPTRLDKIRIPRNQSTSSLASSVATGQKLAINTNQPTRLSFHEGAVSDLEAVAR